MASSGRVLDEHQSSAGLLLALLGQQAMRLLRDAHTELGLKPRQFQLLALLHDHGSMGQRELGEVMGVDPSILVTLLNPLEAAGHVSRRRDAADRRRHTIHLTEAGVRRLTDAAGAQRAAEDALFAGFPDAQREQLRQLLIALKSNVAAGEDAARPPGDC